MAQSAVRFRTLTIAAAAFLVFDGACLVVGGTVLHRPLVAIIGACLVASSALVFASWRWHRGRADEIAAARRALSVEHRALRELIRRN